MVGRRDYVGVLCVRQMFHRVRSIRIRSCLICYVFPRQGGSDPTFGTSSTVGSDMKLGVIQPTV